MARLNDVYKKYVVGRSSFHWGEGFAANLYKDIHNKRIFTPYPSEKMPYFEVEGVCKYTKIEKPSRILISFSGASNLEEQFNELANKWKEETGLYSLPPKKINATYLKIIHRGDVFLPFILNDIMKGGSVYWHFALKAITGNDDIPDDFSKSKALKEAWIKWGKDNFII